MKPEKDMIAGKEDDLLDLIRQLGERFNSGMKLPGTEADRREGRSEGRSEARSEARAEGIPAEIETKVPAQAKFCSFISFCKKEAN